MIAPALRLPRLDLPLGQDASGRFLPWIIALMVYLSGLCGIGLLLLGTALGSGDGPAADALSLQVPADISAPRLAVVVALLRQTPGIVAARPLAADGTLRPIDIAVGPGVRIDVADLRRHLDAVVPGAVLSDRRAPAAPLRGFAAGAGRAIVAGVAAIAAVLVLTVMFAARTGLEIHRPVIEILHLLGAPDRYIAQQFQIHALQLGLRGGAAGAAAAVLTVAVFDDSGGDGWLPLPGLLADWRLWALLAACALAAAIVAMAAARATVSRLLARLP